MRGVILPSTDVNGKEIQNFASVVQICVGEGHALFLTDEGVVYSWAANNDKGQIGRTAPNQDQERRPFPVFTLPQNKDEVMVQIACGNNHCLALSQKGEIWSWGYNKSGQLGTGMPKGNQPINQPNEKVPKQVTFPKDKEGNKPKVKTISCGPCSSAAVSTKGDVFVWGDVSLALYKDRWRGKDQHLATPFQLPGDLVTLGDWKHNIPDKVAVHRTRFATTMSKVGLQDEMLDVLDSLKVRSTKLLRLVRKLGEGTQHNVDDDDEDFQFEELKAMNEDYKRDAENYHKRIRNCEKDLQACKSDLIRIGRDLTVCDQQDTALSEVAHKLEADMGGSGKKNFNTQLEDIKNFKKSNRKSKVALLGQRDTVEAKQWELRQQLTILNQRKTQVASRQKLLKALAKGTLGKGDTSTLDKGIMIAFHKHEELCATYPMQLAGDGRFSGVRDVLRTSDRALGDVSSALKEVSAATSGGDGPILEELLEMNLRLRKSLNQLLGDRFQAAEGVPRVGRSATGGESSSESSGVIQFFKEASLLNPVNVPGKKNMGRGSSAIVDEGMTAISSS